MSSSRLSHRDCALSNGRSGGWESERLGKNSPVHAQPVTAREF
jgi:hypothetical protein